MNIQRIDQILPFLSQKDAIGEETILMQKALRKLGFESDIYAEAIHPALQDQAFLFGAAYDFEIKTNSALIYHFSIGSRIPYRLMGFDVPKIIRFHNITPAHFFEKTQEEQTIHACHLGWLQVQLFSHTKHTLLSDSAYNASFLQGDPERVSQVLPIFRDYSYFAQGASESTKKNPTTFLFVGRISPNKCQHDLIIILDCYRRFIDSQARLILVGGGFSTDYFHSLLALAQTLGLKVGLKKEELDHCDIFFSGFASDDDLRHYYQHSSVFLCMSEHEGFCVPLIEAMTAGLPILAHPSSAVPETLGDAGVLVPKKNMAPLLDELQRLVNDPERRAYFKQKGLERAKHFSLPNTTENFTKFLSDFLEEDTPSLQA